MMVMLFFRVMIVPAASLLVSMIMAMAMAVAVFAGIAMPVIVIAAVVMIVIVIMSTSVVMPVPSARTFMIVAVVMIVVMPAAGGRGDFAVEEIEGTQQEEADTRDQRVDPEAGVEVFLNPPAQVKVEEHAAPEEERADRKKGDDLFHGREPSNSVHRRTQR